MQREFNPNKSEVLHFGKSNVMGKYAVNVRTLSSIDVALRGILGPKSIAP